MDIVCDDGAAILDEQTTETIQNPMATPELHLPAKRKCTLGSLVKTNDTEY